MTAQVGEKRAAGGLTRLLDCGRSIGCPFQDVLGIPVKIDAEY